MLLDFKRKPGFKGWEKYNREDSGVLMDFQEQIQIKISRTITYFTL
jgi:hypothetical protein